MPSLKDTLKCRKCRLSKPKEQYRIVAGPTGRPQRRNTCDGCRQRGEGPYKCAGCHEIMGSDFFPRHACGRRSRKCIQCQEAIAQNLRLCRQCGQQKPAIMFARMRSGMRTYCCDSCREALGSRAHLRKLPDPCLHCGGPMYTGQSRSKASTQKYCSYACSRVAKQFVEAECAQCQKVLPRRLFPQRSRVEIKTKVGGRGRRCTACMEALREGRMSLRAGLTAFASIDRRQAALARKRGIKPPLNRKQVRMMVDGACFFCGGIVEVLTLRASNGPLNEANMLGCCRLCRGMQGELSAKELLAWAKAVVTREAARKPPRVKLLPKRHSAPNVQQDAALRETFEQKMARYAKARAELADAGKRAKPEAENHAV